MTIDEFQGVLNAMGSRIRVCSAEQVSEDPSLCSVHLMCTDKSDVTLKVETTASKAREMLSETLARRSTQNAIAQLVSRLRSCTLTHAEAEDLVAAIRGRVRDVQEAMRDRRDTRGVRA